MNEKQLAEIEARAKAATPGPWASFEVTRDGSTVETAAGEILMGSLGSPDATSADTDFVAHAREDVPSLLAEVRRLRKIIAEQIGALEVDAEAEPECTGVAAGWCPACGDCKCPRDEEGHLSDEGLNSPECPLHHRGSPHAAKPVVSPETAARKKALDEAEAMIRGLAEDARDDGDGSDGEVPVALDDAADAIRSLGGRS